MPSSWVDHGPIALPPKSLVYGAATAVVLTAIVGLGLGFKAAWREAPIPGLDAGKSVAADGSLIAKPLVDIAPPVEPPDATKDAEAQEQADTDKEKADALAAEAKARAVQAKTAKADGNIDEILTNKAEKPPAPVKAPADEAPGAPVKSDVPF